MNQKKTVQTGKNKKKKIGESFFRTSGSRSENLNINSWIDTSVVSINQSWKLVDRALSPSCGENVEYTKRHKNNCLFIRKTKQTNLSNTVLQIPDPQI